MESGIQLGLTGEDEMELGIQHELPQVQLQALLTFIFNYIIISKENKSI